MTVSCLGNSQATKALLDTGAPRCLFPRGIGDLLQVDFTRAPVRTTSRFLGQSWHSVTQEVTLSLGSPEFTWSAVVDFVKEEGLPFSLLVREGFMTQWAVSFNGALGYSAIHSAEEFHEDFDRTALSTLGKKHPGLMPPGLLEP